MARWVIHSRAAFDARHALTSYLGEPEEAHEHRWEVAIRVGTDALNREGYAIDFHAVHELLQRVVSPLEGSDLNLHPEIGDPTPSAERMAEVIAAHLASELDPVGGRLLSVSVWEGPDNRVDLNLSTD